jgi:hypothetical protein
LPDETNKFRPLRNALRHLEKLYDNTIKELKRNLAVTFLI